MKKLAFLKSILTILTFFGTSSLHAQTVNVSGTPNAHSLTKWVSGTEIANSQVVDEGGYVKIGTIVPAAKLTIQNGSSIDPAAILENLAGTPITEDMIGIVITSQSAGLNVGTVSIANETDALNIGLLGLGLSSGSNSVTIGIIGMAKDGNESIATQGEIRVSADGVVQRAIAFHSIFDIDNSNQNTIVDEAYGLYLEDIPSPATLQYGVYQNGDDQNYFGGKVGIGNSAAAYDLDVAGTTKTNDLRIVNGAAEDFVLQSDVDGNASWVDINTIQNWERSGNNLYPANAGDKIGIGTTTPREVLDVTGVNAKVVIGTRTITSGHTDFKLSVDGKIVASEVVVLSPNSNAWADYVFSKNYRLSSLEEVETFINTHSHLPGVPTAAEVSAAGINMAEMSATLLLKVEELTLYIIQQNKRIEQLELQVKQ